MNTSKQAAFGSKTTTTEERAIRRLEQLRRLDEAARFPNAMDHHIAVKMLLREAHRYESLVKGVGAGGSKGRADQTHFERKLWWSNLAEDATDVLEFGVDPGAVKRDAAALQLWVADEEFFPSGELGDVQAKETRSFHQRRWNVLASLPPGELFHPVCLQQC